MKRLTVKFQELTWDGKSTVESTSEYAVNKYNEGLFVRKHDGSWAQVLGTGQFCAKSPRELMRKLRSRWRGAYGTIHMVRGSACGWD